jgi:Cytosol aminopeptidase family, N-terminal domain
MKLRRCALPVALLLLAGLAGLTRSGDDKTEVKEKALEAPNGLAVKVRMEGPYTADVPLQVVCYFKYTPEGAKKMTGAPVELDKKLGGVIASLRERGEFVGDEGETLLLTPPGDAIKAKALLLVGLGDEGALSLDVLERVGRVSLREAARLGTSRVGYAPLIRDQGNSRFGTGDVARAVLRGVLLAYDTEKRLQKEGLAKKFTLEQWNVEAGPAFFDDTVVGVQKGIEEAKAAAARRPSDPYRSSASNPK